MRSCRTSSRPPCRRRTSSTSLPRWRRSTPRRRGRRSRRARACSASSAATARPTPSAVAEPSTSARAPWKSSSRSPRSPRSSPTCSRKGGTLRATTEGHGRHLRGGRPRDRTTMDALYRGPGASSHFVPGLDGRRAELGVDERHPRRGRQHHAGTPARSRASNRSSCTSQDGLVAQVEGRPAAAEWKRMGDELDDPNAFAIAEYGFGAHPRARTPVGWPVEDERIYGGFHLRRRHEHAYSAGTNRTGWHIDASCLAASAWFNGRAIPGGRRCSCLTGLR